MLDGGKAWILRFEQVTQILNGRRYSYRVPLYLRPDDFRTLYMNRRVNTGYSMVAFGLWWLKHPERRQHLGVCFEPGNAPVVNGKLNLWTGWGVTPKAGDWTRMRDHIHEVLARSDDGLFEYILNWIAWAFQHPGQQAEAAPVFLGKRGSGRGTLGNALCRIFGNHQLHITSPQHLVGRFNAHLRQCAFATGAARRPLAIGAGPAHAPLSPRAAALVRQSGPDRASGHLQTIFGVELTCP